MIAAAQYDPRIFSQQGTDCEVESLQLTSHFFCTSTPGRDGPLFANLLICKFATSPRRAPTFDERFMARCACIRRQGHTAHLLPTCKHKKRTDSSHRPCLPSSLLASAAMPDALQLEARSRRRVRSSSDNNNNNRSINLLPTRKVRIHTCNNTVIYREMRDRSCAGLRLMLCELCSGIGLAAHPAAACNAVATVRHSCWTSMRVPSGVYVQQSRQRGTSLSTYIPGTTQICLSLFRIELREIVGIRSLTRLARPGFPVPFFAGSSSTPTSDDLEGEGSLVIRHDNRGRPFWCVRLLLT